MLFSYLRKRVNTPCGQNVELLVVEADGGALSGVSKGLIVMNGYNYRREKSRLTY